MKKQNPRLSTWVITLMTVIALLVTVTLLGCSEPGNPTRTCGHCGQVYDISTDGNKHSDCRYCDRPICIGDHGEGVCNKTEGELRCPQCDEVVEDKGEHWNVCTYEHYICDGKEHEKLTCSHEENGQELEHYTCDGREHTTGECGQHLQCDGVNHDELPCGEDHFWCDGGNHAAFHCGEGHMGCDGRDHSEMGCGHHVCSNLMGCGHCSACSGTEGHGKCRVCGSYFCSGKKDHGVADCGHHVCETGFEEAHEECALCGVCTSLGEHGVGVCPSFPCDFCGSYTVTEGEHIAPCGEGGHCTCDGNDHDLCSRCNTYFCQGWHFTLGCGHVMCENALEDGLHTHLPCGHWSHNGTPLDGGDHTAMMPCGSHYVCIDGDNAAWHTPKDCGHAPCARCSCEAGEAGE